MRTILTVLVASAAWTTTCHAEVFEAMPISVSTRLAPNGTPGVDAVIEVNGKKWRLILLDTGTVRCTNIDSFIPMFEAAAKQKQAIKVDLRFPLSSYDKPTGDQPRSPLSPVLLNGVRIFDSDFKCARYAY